MKKSLLVFFGFLIWVTAFSQNMEEFNRYKYIAVETMIDKKTERVDHWGVSMYTRYKLIKMGYTIIDDRRENWKEEVLENECQVAYCDITDNTKMLGWHKLDLFFYNCKGDTILFTKGKGNKEDDRESYQEAIDKALKPFEGFEYSFNESQSLGPLLAEVETSNETEAELITYLDSEGRDEVEGIYKFENQNYKYRVGIKRSENNYQGIVLETSNENWQESEIKIYLESSILGEDVFSITWIDHLKNKSQTVGKLLEDGNLVVEIKNEGSKGTLTLFKEYPTK